MRVLVTGHTGYIGSRLTPMLLEAGHEVTGLDTDLFRDCTFVGELADVPHIHRDVRDVTIEDVTAGRLQLEAVTAESLGGYLDAGDTPAWKGVPRRSISQKSPNG